MLNTVKKQTLISFLLDGEPFLYHSPQITVKEDGNKKVTVYEFSDGLRLTNTLVVYPEHSACDWVNDWEYNGNTQSGLISELWDCQAELPFPRSEEKDSPRAYLPEAENVVKVYAPRGSDWSSREFSCDADVLEGNHFKNWLVPGDKRWFSTIGGRSSESVNSPFFHVRHGKEDFGIIAAVGWTGQWNAQIERYEDSIVFKSKVQDTKFRLLPGERFRTSSVTLMSYTGTLLDGQNAWRRFIKEQYSPIGKREVPELAPFCAGLWGGMSSKGAVERIRAVEREKLPFDHYWMDAGWYGAGVEQSPDEYEGDWAEHTGNWEINKTRHPDMMKSIVDEIKKSTKRFILWFEPERVRRNAPIVSEHPEYLLFLGDTEENTLLNLGCEEAWQYCFDTLSTLIEQLNVSVYRQDFNFRPLPYWQKYDTEERIGITEIKHINGLYRLWDALLEKFPALLIDNCASGGRRIDVETLRRSVPLWRSDAQCPADPLPHMAQAHAISHSAWMPYSGTGTGRVWFDTYRFRSSYSPALTTNYTFSEKNSFGDDPEAIEWLRKMCCEYLRVRPYLSEDVYPLTAASGAADVWSAIQYHNPKSNSGVIQAFRREESPYECASMRLHGLDRNAEYTVEDVDGGEATFRGDELSDSGLAICIKERRASKLFFYKAK